MKRKLSNYSHNERSRKHKGFSLIELLIVIAVIGIFSGIAIQAFGKFTEEATRHKNRRNAQSVAWVANCAIASGATLPIDDMTALVTLLNTTGVNGVGQMSANNYNVKHLGADEISAVLEYLSFGNGGGVAYDPQDY